MTDHVKTQKLVAEILGSDKNIKESKEAKEAKEVVNYRARRNAPCPCGSGKKFKRCCLRGGQR